MPQVVSDALNEAGRPRYNLPGFTGLDAPVSAEEALFRSTAGPTPMTQTDKNIRIQVNGETLAIEHPATVAGLVDLRKPRPPFAVELNKELVRRPSYDTTRLTDGDQVEIVTLVGGG